MAHLVGRTDDRHAIAVAAVDGHDGEPGAFRPDEDEAITLALVVQRREVGAAEDHVGGVGQRRVAAHGDAEALAHQAGAAVGADQIAGRDRPGAPVRVSRTVATTASAVSSNAISSGRCAGTCGNVRRTAAGSDRTCPAARVRASAGFPAGIFECASGEWLAPELVAGERCDADVVLRIVARIGRIAHPVRDTPAAAEFHGAQADEVHLADARSRRRSSRSACS